MTDAPPLPPDDKPARDKPRIKIVPPYAAAICLAIGIILNFIVPLHPFAFWTSFFIGLLLTPLGVIVVVWAVNTLTLHGTAVRIDRPVTKIVTHGPYSVNRNPIYVGGAIAYAGIALMFNSGWALLLLIPLLLVIHKRVVLPEEAYLEKKFGATYLDYKARTKRWL